MGQAGAVVGQSALRLRYRLFRERRRLVHLDGASRRRHAGPDHDGRIPESGPQWSPDGRALFWVSDRDGSRDIYRQRIGAMGRRGRPSASPPADAHGISLARTGRRWRIPGSGPSPASGRFQVPRPGPLSAASARRSRPGTRPSRTWTSPLTAAGWCLTPTGAATPTCTSCPRPVGSGPDHHRSSRRLQPRLVPGGRQIVFHSLRNGDRDIYTVNADGTGIRRRRRRRRGTRSHLVAGRGARLRGDLGERAVAPHGPPVGGSDSGRTSTRRATSPAGRLAAVDPLSRRRRVAPGLRAGGQSRLLVSNAVEDAEAFFADWSPDGTTLYFLARRPAGWSIRSMPAAGGNDRPDGELRRSGPPATRYGFTTDGRNFYFTVGSPESDIWVMELESR